MKVVDSISNALQGLLRAQEKVAESADKIAKGDTSVDTLVENKLNATDVKIQAKNLKAMTELEDEVLDIIA